MPFLSLINFEQLSFSQATIRWAKGTEDLSRTVTFNLRRSNPIPETSPDRSVHVAVNWENTTVAYWVDSEPVFYVVQGVLVVDFPPMLVANEPGLFVLRTWDASPVLHDTKTNFYLGFTPGTGNGNWYYGLFNPNPVPLFQGERYRPFFFSYPLLPYDLGSTTTTGGTELYIVMSANVTEDSAEYQIVPYFGTSVVSPKYIWVDESPLLAPGSTEDVELFLSQSPSARIGSLTVSISSSSGYVSAPSSVTFNLGESVKTISVSVTSDAPLGTVALLVFTPSNYEEYDDADMVVLVSDLGSTDTSSSTTGVSR